jgi:uncharacterized protein (DUF58 family)
MAASWTKYFDPESVTKLAHIGFKPSGLVEGHLVGNHRSPFHGFAIEFAGHRGYVPGDDIRHLDWTAYYKTDRYLLKQYEQETNFVAHLLVDVSASMKFGHEHGTKQDYAAFIATALAQLVVNQSDSVGVTFFDEEIVETLPVTGGQDVIGKIANFYTDRPCKSGAGLGRVLDLVAEQSGRRRVMFLISDFFGDPEETFRGIRRLLDAKHEVVLLQIVDPLELSFNIPGKVKFVDLEGGASFEARGSTIRDSYEELFSAFLEDVRGRALRLGVDHIRCDMDKPFGTHLAAYLSKREAR